jgi:pilus assembly protein CpaE
VAKIYVIDDDDQLLRMVGLMLERGGHNATLINNPTQGLEKVKADKPDLLVLDVMMPGMSGHDVCRQIRATQEVADLPILILTARAQDVDRAAALRSGANDYLSKPVTSQELVEKVDGLLNKQQAGKQEASEGTVTCVFAMRGGVGRTTLAVNIAVALRKVSQEEVCLIDLSPSGDQVMTHLRQQARATWENLPSGDGLNWDELKKILSIHQSGLRILAAPQLPQSPLTPTATAVTNLLKILKENVLFTIVDLPPILSPAVIAAITASDMLLHVVTPDVVSVQIAVQTNRALTKSGIAIKQRAHILNQIAPEGQLPAAAVERALNSRLAFQVGYDSNQPRSLAQGVPLSLSSMQSPLPVIARRMAEAMWQRLKEG